MIPHLGPLVVKNFDGVSKIHINEGRGYITNNDTVKSQIAEEAYNCRGTPCNSDSGLQSKEHHNTC